MPAEVKSVDIYLDSIQDPWYGKLPFRRGSASRPAASKIAAHRGRAEGLGFLQNGDVGGCDGQEIRSVRVTWRQPPVVFPPACTTLMPMVRWACPSPWGRGWSLQHDTRPRSEATPV